MTTYSFQVAYLNALRVKKVIPNNILQEINSNKNLSMLVSVLKDYNYRKIFDLKNTDQEILDSAKFESILEQELNDTLETINGLIKEKDKFIIEILTYFFNTELDTYEKIVLFFKQYKPKIEKLNSTLCCQLLKLIIDFENIKLFLSYIILGTKSVKFIPDGNINPLVLKEIFPSVENLNKVFSVVYYSPAIKVSIEPQNKNFNYYFIYYLQQLVWESKFYYFTIEPIIFYFFEKFIEVQYLKKIYYSIKGVSYE